MKIKQIAKLSMSILTVISLSSCSKKVTDRKLDGDWKMSSGTSTIAVTYEGMTQQMITTFDGTNKTGFDLYGETSQLIVSGYTEKITFDKKNGTFTKIITENALGGDDDLEYITVYDANGVSLGSGTIVKTNSSVKTTISGVYTITGGSGEIKKNSEIVLHLRSVKEEKSGTQKVQVMDFNTNINSTIENAYDSDGKKIGSSFSESTSYTGELTIIPLNIYVPTILKVTKLTRNEMELEDVMSISGSSDNAMGDFFGEGYSVTTKMTYKQ